MEARKKCIAVNKKAPCAGLSPSVWPQSSRGRMVVPCNRRGPCWGENLPFGRASIASGYTPAAFAGAKPLHPLPLKGRKET